ncbi:hypothetical protein [Kitasatospora purpeofusca]|uniref:hypothetical protein n=1 Tax=Kitasatospora purpeofusca TaxID=67352 RepID=UPI0036D41184
MTSDQQGGPARRWRAAALAAVGVGMAGALFLGGVKATELWQGEPFPVADPVAVAGRLDARTQAVYDALLLPDAPLNREWPSEGIEASIYDCHPRGLAHFLDSISDSPPREPGTTAVHESWALAGVTHAQAVDAMARARQTLTAAGWKVTSYTDLSPDDVTLRLKPPQADDGVTDGVTDGVSVALYPRGNLAVFAGTDCIRMPDTTPVDFEGRPDVPGPSAPVQLRDRRTAGAVAAG